MRFSSFLSLAAVGLIATAAQGAAVSWDGGASTSSWHDADNWSPNGVPGAADQVTIGVAGAPGTSYAVNVTSSVIMDSLTLNASSSVNITGGGAEAIFQVDGGNPSVLNPLTVIELEDINATLLFSTASQSITGGGTIQLDDAGALLEIGSGLTLTSDVVVQGYGSMAPVSGTATFINQEVVTANSASGALELFTTLILDDIASADWKAESGGELQFKRTHIGASSLVGELYLIGNGSQLTFTQSVNFDSTFTWNAGTVANPTAVFLDYGQTDITLSYDDFAGTGGCNPDASGPPYSFSTSGSDLTDTCGV